MEIKDILLEISARNAQGQLVIKFIDEDHLCKILLENGRAVHIALARYESSQILEIIKTKKIEWTRFIDNFPVRKKLDFPLHDQLLGVDSAPSPASSGAPTAVTSPGTAPAIGSYVDGTQIDQVKQSFLDLIGPEGTIQFMMAAAAVNYDRDQPLSREKYVKFVQSLSQDLPEKQRGPFFQAHMTL